MNHYNPQAKQIPNKLASFIIYYLKPFKAYFFGLCAIMIFIGLTPAIDGILFKNIIDSFAELENNSVDDLFYIILGWTALYLLYWEGCNIAWRLYDYCYYKLAPELKSTFMLDMYNYIQYQTHNFLQKRLVGSFSTRITETSKALELFVAHFTEALIGKGFVAIGVLASLYYAHKIFFVIMLVWLVFFVGSNLIFFNKISNLASNYSHSRAIIGGKLIDALANISTIRLFSSQKFERKYINKYTDFAIDEERKMLGFMIKLRYFQGLSTSILIGFLVYYSISLKAAGQITIGDIALVLQTSISLIEAIWGLIQDIGDIFENLGVIKQLTTMIKPINIKDKDNAKQLVVNHGVIEFKNVTFNYERNNNIFKNKTLKINNHEKIGLVGFSGSGKTTFVNLILRLFEIENGQILIDKQDITNVTQNSLRNHISVIPQEPILFHRSIKENIAYGNFNASDEEIYEAAKKAHIYNDIMKLKHGFETICGERGTSLSGGQRQRVAIARAILKNAPILILDEATSALDSETENMIQASLDELMQNKTVIIIAHRLSTLLNMDRILVFDKGTVIESGSHQELIDKNGHYKKLWSSQVKGFIAKKPNK